MSWLELLERNLIVLARLNHFALGYFFGEFRYRREQHWLVRTFEVFELFPVEKGNEIRDGIDLECLSGITSLLGIDGSKDQVLIVICFGSGFECGLDSHARWAGLGPEVDDEARAVFYQFLEVCVVGDLADLANSWLLSRRRSLTAHAAHASKSLHQILHHCRIHITHHLLKVGWDSAWWHTWWQSTAPTSTTGTAHTAHRRHSSSTSSATHWRHTASTSHTTHRRHAPGSSPSGTSLPSKNTRWRLTSQLGSTSLLIEQCIALHLETILGLLHHWCNHLTQWRL